MGLICSKTRKLPQVINKNLSTPKLPQLKAPTTPNILDTKSTVSSKQPRKGVVADIAKTAAGVAIGNVIGKKITNTFDENRDVKNAAESPIETDYSIDNKSENKELTQEDNDLNGQEDELTEYDHNDAYEENDNDSE